MIKANSSLGEADLLAVLIRLGYFLRKIARETEHCKGPFCGY
jgi:hypothetical protein